MKANNVMDERDPVLNKIIETANAGYPDDVVSECWDNRKSSPRDNDCGDTLALFIAREISDLCEGEDLAEGLSVASYAMSGAAHQLEELAEHLELAARAAAIESEGGELSNNPTPR